MGLASWEAALWLLAPRYGAMLRQAVHNHVNAGEAGLWLDVGCGLHSPIARTLPGRVIGVDSAMRALRQARHDDLSCVCASATDLPFATGVFDGVFCFGLLHHLNDKDAGAALAQMRRVARSGGVVLVFDSVNPVSAVRRPLAALLRSLDRGHHVRDEAALRRLLGQHGFVASPRCTYSWTGMEGCWAVGADGAD